MMKKFDCKIKKDVIEPNKIIKIEAKNANDIAPEGVMFSLRIWYPFYRDSTQWIQDGLKDNLSVG